MSIRSNPKEALSFDIYLPDWTEQLLSKELGQGIIIQTQMTWNLILINRKHKTIYLNFQNSKVLK